MNDESETASTNPKYQHPGNIAQAHSKEEGWEGEQYPSSSQYQALS
jgi:hypothetical protein